ncbi:MAG: histidine kinase [Clostridia bacterium]|nr:histidine kinase [Clostridia bacterium]
MEKNHRRYSLALRLLSTIMLGMLALNIFTIYSTNRLSVTAADSIVQEYKQIQEMYAEEIARQMNQAQIRITNMGASYLADIGTNYAALHDERQYEAVRCQTEINTALRNWQIQYPMITGYYVYGREADLFIYKGDRFQDNQWFSGEIRGDGSSVEAPFRQMGGWQMIDTPMGEMLLYNTVRRDLCYGVWIGIDKIWRSLGLNEENGNRSFSIVLSDSPQDIESMDISLDTTGFSLRQTLPKMETMLPKSIKLLQMLSYAMLLILPISWFVLRKLVIQPLGELIKAIREIEHGNTKYRIPEKSTSSEFDQLNKQFNRSVERIDSTNKQIYETRLENEKTRIQYLTQQMQPHFVLNTLNLIYSMEPSQYKLMQKTIQCLSRYFRYIAHVSDPLVPVEAELEHVKNYFQLQQIRYPDNFDYHIYCPEELLEALIPPIVIQTFAENAIKHSLTIGEQNQVEVSIEKENDERIHIQIHDSGTGYPQEVLEKIWTFQQTRQKQEGLGLGIQNTIERIDLIYEEGTDLVFSNAPQGGAQVDIYLPEMGRLRKHEKS